MSGKLATDPLTQTATTQNQFSGFCYDIAGNLLGQSGCPGLPYTPTYSYDAENRMTTTAGVTYTYDGDGKRVKKSSGTLYWTGMGSDALDETDLAGTVQREYVYFNGKRVARLTPPSTVRYFFSDHLGSHDLVTSATGAIQEESDYHPYGEEAVIVDTLSTQPYKFTGKERDAESGLDYFGARFYGSALARFTSADPGGIKMRKLSDPQSLNRYSYVRNNPLASVDPDGKDYQAFFDKQTNTLTMKANVVLTGSALTPAIVGNFKSSVQNLLGGTHKSTNGINLNIQVVVTDNPKDPKLIKGAPVNTMSVEPNVKTEVKPSTGNGQQGTGNPEDLSKPNVPAHEAVHYLGGEDTYVKDQNGQYIGPPIPGNEGSLMGDPTNPNAQLSQQEINSLTQGACAGQRSCQQSQEQESNDQKGPEKE